MGAPVRLWLEQQNLLVKSEFVTPWGICDFVGLRFNKEHARQRLNLRQTRAITSMNAVAMLLQIPDVSTTKAVSIAQLVKRYKNIISKPRLLDDLSTLVKGRFVVNSAGRLQKINGWAPLQERIVAVEMKLGRIEEALSQARNNASFASESYVALPHSVADNILRSEARRARFESARIGLLAVTMESCRVVIAAEQVIEQENPAFSFHCVEKFWHSHSKTIQH